MTRPLRDRSVRRILRAVARAGAVGLAGHTWLNTRLIRTPPPAADVPERVSVLLPARNEAERLAPALTALLAGRGVPALEVVVLDDASTDGTAELARTLAGADPRVRVVTSDVEPPPGWLGKPHACARLAELADGASTVLVFLDADVVLAPDGLARTVRLLREAELGFVSPYPRQIARGVLERLVQPLLQWSWLTLVPLRLAEHSARPSLALANGQLLAVDAALYRRSGGHAAAPAAVLEDIALARTLRAAGGSGGMADGTDVATCRMYRSGRELVDGYAKSLWATAGGSATGSAAQVAVLLGLFARPDPVAYAAGVASRLLAARRTGGSLPDAAAHPVSVAVYAALTLLSWTRRRAGTARWKGRTLA